MIAGAQIINGFDFRLIAGILFFSGLGDFFVGAGGSSHDSIVNRSSN